ncbi:transcription elongation factor [Mesonia sp. K4-1]|uniref:transcription elongation factor n=1 Tax=Mesonia sp. K4-1 TaxID=2602760 RepID=UPI0011CC7EBE|nr:transcription elongation factor [Mesonia sp. K4-1]TXK78581.1 transcription elongation factor [Mesonia sp. K4-1]
MREELLRSCHTYVNERILRLEASVRDLEHDLGNETKSSAGDKYETSREMINAEISQLERQLKEFKKLKGILSLPQLQKASTAIQLGSIVITNAANYFVAIPVGEVNIDKEKFYAIGINSPMAQLLNGKQKGDVFTFREKEVKILDVY